VTRLIPRKSLLVLALLVTVFGFSAGAALAAAQPSPAVTTRHVTVTLVHHQGAGPTAADLQAVTTAYSAGSAPQLINTTAPAGPIPAGTAPQIEPAGICSVPGINSIGSLFGYCNQGAGSSGLLGGLNSICTPSLPQPEPANSGIDSIVRPPATSASQGKTLYDNYGVAGQFWAPYGLQCSDMTSMIGNNVAGMVFDASKAVDRVTITVYQSAAGNGILSWLTSVVNRLVSSLGNAIYFPYLAPVVLLAVVWMAWTGLIRKRATRTIEGTVWMVIACVAAIWLIARPGDFTGFGQSVSNGVTQVLNVAFSKLPSPNGQNCVPVGKGDPQSPPTGNYGFTQGNGMVDQNANELWSVLVCKPWLDGEFGTTQYATGKNGQTAVNKYGRQLLWAQAIAANEKPTASVIQAKQSAYAGIASSIKQNDPSIYPLFQGNQWTSRLEIGFAALFAALVAGVLILLIAVTLIILKLGFLLLLIAGPFFLLVGTHPGFGRVVALRWVEMIIGVLLKQVAVALVLSVLLYAYSLIMGTSDTVLPWALKILMIALVTVAVFIYRKPFQHLFSAVTYSTDRRDRSIERSRDSFRASTLSAAAVASGFAGSRLGRWSRRDTGDSAALADHIAAVGAGGASDPELAAGQTATATGHVDVDAAAEAETAGAGARAVAGGGRARAATEADTNGRTAPPLHLPSRAEGSSTAPSGWARGGAEGTGTGRPQAQAGSAPPRTITPTGASIGAAGSRPAVTSGSPRQAPASAQAAPPSRPAPPSRSAQAPRSSGQRQTPQWTSSRQEGPPPRTSPAAPRPASSSGGSRPAPASSGPPSGGGRPAASGSSPRARWQEEAPPRPAPPSHGGRPRWRPGPIRPSSGWSGGSGAASAPPPPRQAPPPRQSPPPAPRPAPPPPSRQASSGGSFFGGGPSNGGPAQASQYGSGQPGAGQYGSGQYGGGHGQPGAGASGGQGGGGHSGPSAPAPFWLRPWRKK
jgi:hypothetical protein